MAYADNVINELKNETDHVPNGTQHGGIPRVRDAKCERLERLARYSHRALTGK